jgi:ATP sulfurylase (sulfate adenylyltransferase)
MEEKKKKYTRLTTIAFAQEKKALWQEISQLPRITLTDRQLYDLELLLNGSFSPLQGFLNTEDYESVVEHSRLSDGSVWPIPVVLDVKEKGSHKIGERLVLCDKFGKPLAVMDVESVYTPDKQKEAKAVYGTTDINHFGVRMLLEQTGDVYLGGKVHGIELPQRYDFLDLRRTPEELRQWFKGNGWDRVVGFQTRNPMHRAHFEIVKRATEEIEGKALIHPVVGMTKDGDIDYITRVRSYRHVHHKHAQDFATISLLPLAMRMARLARRCGMH